MSTSYEIHASLIGDRENTSFSKREEGKVRAAMKADSIGATFRVDKAGFGHVEWEGSWSGGMDEEVQALADILAPWLGEDQGVRLLYVEQTPYDDFYPKEEE